MSLRAVQRIAACFGLEVVDVEELPHTVEVSSMVYSQRFTEPSLRVAEVLADELDAGLESFKPFASENAVSAKHGLMEFLLMLSGMGWKKGYGAAAKGNTLLNYAGSKADLLHEVADRAPSKQGHYLPGSHIPVISPENMNCESPDLLLVLPWNLINEVGQQLPQYELVTAIPNLCRWGKVKC